MCAQDTPSLLPPTEGNISLHLKIRQERQQAVNCGVCSNTAC